MKREAQFQTLFRHWLKANPQPTAAYELKQTTTDSIPFSDVQPHQIDALMAAKHGALLHKIDDSGRGIKPFDMVYLHIVDAWIVIRYPKCFCIIDVDRFIGERKRSSRKSLISERAREIAHVTIEL